MDKPTKRDTKAIWIAYATHLESANDVRRAEVVEAAEVALGLASSGLDVVAENARLREHLSQLKREIHRLKGRG